MKLFKKIQFVTLVTLGIFLLPTVSLALGQLTQPIVVKNAAKGQVITEKLKLFNSDSTEKEFGLIAEGDITDWAKFYKVGDLNNPIIGISIPAKSSVDAIVIFTVPKGAANKTYKGEVSVTSAPVPQGAEEGSSASVVQKVARLVTITVTGKEEISAEVSVIPVSYLVETGKPLTIRFQYYNTGNVDITPQVQVKIKDINQEKVIATTIYPYPEDTPAIKPLERKENSPIEVSTSSLNKGRYWAFVTITEKDKVLHDSKFRFQIGTGGNVLGAAFAGISGGVNIWYIALPLALAVIIALALFVLKKKR